MKQVQQYGGKLHENMAQLAASRVDEASRKLIAQADRGRRSGRRQGHSDRR